MIQYMIVGFVLAASLAYVIRMIIRTFKVSRNACGGCKGCAMRSQMMRNQQKKEKKKLNYQRNC
ncbi:FeoB-associated Cys-rich membrane protein [Prevotella disiens]